MATFRDTVLNLLRTDTASGGVAALLNYPAVTKAIVDSRDLPSDYGISWAPKDSRGRIAPHIIVRLRERQPFGAPKIGSEQSEFEVYAYQQRGYDVIDPVLKRVKALLHPDFFYTDDLGMVRILWTFTSAELDTDEYNGAPLRFSRFQVT